MLEESFPYLWVGGAAGPARGYQGRHPILTRSVDVRAQLQREFQ